MGHYRYDTWDAPGSRKHTTTLFREVVCPKSGEVVLVHDMRMGKADKVVFQIRNQEDIDQWDMKLERDAAWGPHIPEGKNYMKPDGEIRFYKEGQLRFSTEGTELKDHINPTHYKEIVPGMQYMEMMQYMLRGKSGVVAHLYGQIYKYLMRTGKKDEEIQELKKVKWYLDFLIAHLQKGQPITVAEIEHLLKIEGSVL